jgi:hypothetical protein
MDAKIAEMCQSSRKDKQYPGVGRKKKPYCLIGRTEFKAFFIAWECDMMSRGNMSHL